MTDPTSASIGARRDSGDAGTGTVRRALMLLTLIAEGENGVTVKEVADSMALAPSTAHRLLQLLKTDGFVEASPSGRRYVIGPTFYRVAARVVFNVPHPKMAQATIDAIASIFDETVMFGLYLPKERAMSFAARADGEQKLKYQIEMHKPMSLVWGASGKAILAFLPTSTAQDVAAVSGPSQSGALAPPWSALKRELKQIRERGYAVSESQKLPGARGVAAPVFGPDGVLGCICLTSPIARMPHASIEAIGQEVTDRAAHLSQVLGALV